MMKRVYDVAEILFLWTGIIVWYAALVLLIARIIHGPAWSHEHDDYDEFEDRRDNAQWS